MNAGNAPLWGWALEDKSRSLQVQYCSVDNTFHALVHAVLIMDYKCWCADVVPSRLGKYNWLTFGSLSSGSWPQNPYGPTLHSDLQVNICLSQHQGDPSLLKSCVWFPLCLSFIFCRMTLLPATQQFYLVRATKIECLTGKVISFFSK